MRHFGDSAQPNNTGMATDAPLTAVPRSEAGSLARFIHDQFSPANRYDMSAPSPYQAARNNNDSAAAAAGKSEQANSADLKTLPALSFKPEQATNSDLRKTVEVKALGNLFSPAPEQATAASMLRASKESFASSVIEDFRSPFKSIGQLSVSGDNQADNRADKIAARDAAFEAANCYQTISINPQEGSTKTITTLSDLSSSRIHIKSVDGSSVTYTDRLGRPVSESRFDASGKLVSETSAQFDNSTNAAIPTKKIVRTAHETTEISLDSRGLVLAKTTLPYSDLNNA
ncbi:hypothetical protein BH11CYA1_BH11CYA1_14470 [soil metagenome]